MLEHFSTTTYSSSSTGAATVAATVDRQTVNCTVVINSDGKTTSGGSGGGANTDTGIGVADDLKTGESVSLMMDKGAVYRVVLSAGADIKKLMLTVKKESSAPLSAGEPETEVYEYEDVTLYYAEDSDLFGRTFYFKIPESRLASGGYSYNDITMLVFNKKNGGWDKLKTIYDGKKDGYYYYISESPYISLMAISYIKGETILPAGEEKAAEITAAATPTVKEAPSAAASVSPSKTSAPSSEGEKKSGLSVIAAAVALLLIFITVIWTAGRKKRDEYPDWWDNRRK